MYCFVEKKNLFIVRRKEGNSQILCDVNSTRLVETSSGLFRRREISS